MFLDQFEIIGIDFMFWGILNTYASVAQLDARPTGDQEVAGSTASDRQYSFVKI